MTGRQGKHIVLSYRLFPPDLARQINLRLYHLTQPSGFLTDLDPKKNRRFKSIVEQANRKLLSLFWLYLLICILTCPSALTSYDDRC